MDDDAERCDDRDHRDHRDDRDHRDHRDHHPEHGEPPGRLDRRHFLGAAAAGAAGIAVVAVAGCDSPAGGGPEAAPSRTGADPTAAAATERARSGSPDWRIRSLGPPEAVEGYTDTVSVEPGDEFGLYVSTTAPGFRVSAYRVGWYGGAQARLVWRSDRVPGRVQRDPRVDTFTDTVRADWERTLAVRADGWPEGAYLLRLDASNGHQRYVPLIVRSPSAAGRTVLMHAPATWQAYNLWGGYSLYEGKDGAYGSRSLAVSFDRPYDKNGAEKFLTYERAAVVLAERLGIPLAYTTGVDVHLTPSALRGATAVVSLGHDEYWTPEQRKHLTKARDTGTNLVFLGANTCFRRVRLERKGDSGPVRTVVCFKTDYEKDPYLVEHRAMVTTDFRAPPSADPESSLTGVLYEGFPTDAPYVVHGADHWIFEGTGVRRGDSFDHLVGVEYDRVTPDQPTPSPLEIVAHSPLVCKGRDSHADSAYYTVPSGAGVFASGTMRWVEGLMAGTGENGRNHGMDARTGAFVTRTTENVLRAFAEGPAGRHRPAPKDNVRSVYGRTAPESRPPATVT
ncbi:N,N-dimethylformamidase beta subunit family domain-containing protein [Streptomyces niveus]|uniref:N,N-dimethylformamidase beta subunit family domain-containing protein n=1 Tax=Streptomyces niveus TaxID=193462 RepID=UPI001F2ED032|nr:N,N-dimethylformamidase beta subunit family domain-containing protein [Streptomyces niveus]